MEDIFARLVMFAYFQPDEEIRVACMGADSVFVRTEEVAKNLQSDFQRNREEAWGRCSVDGEVSCPVKYDDSLVWVIASFLRLKMHFGSGERGSNCTISLFLTLP